LRYEQTDSFRGDYKRLNDAEKTLFHQAVQEFSEACDAHVRDRQPFPGHLRVKPVQGAPGIFEMTWSFSGPDGRATWEWGQVEVEEAGTVRREPAVLWRRLGDHSILKGP
jgi:hypothetical protein